MTLVFFFKTPEIINFYHFPLMQDGYVVAGFSEVDKLTDYLEKNECQLLIMDYEDYCSSFDTILAKIRLVSEKTQIILITLATYMAIKQQILKYKIYGVISKPSSYPKILEQIRDYIELIEKKPLHSLRKYPRFRIPDNLKNIVKIIFKDLNSSYIGRMTDISLGGIGVSLHKEMNKYLVFKGKKGEVIIEMENLSIEFKGEIVNSDSKKKLGVCFKIMTPQTIIKIKSFILDLIGKEKKE